MTCRALPPFPEGTCPECSSPVQPPGSASVTVEAGAPGNRFMVTVYGELDLASTQILQHRLDDALRDATDGLELDLAGVDFCDCSALNVLLLIRRNARETAKSVVLRASSPAVKRLLELTHTDALFAGESSGKDLATENAQLHRALETRASIDRACGMLMTSFHLTAEQAWRVLVTVSQHSNTKLHVIADSLLQSIAGRPLPESLADHLAAAVQTHGAPGPRSAAHS